MEAARKNPGVAADALLAFARGEDEAGQDEDAPWVGAFLVAETMQLLREVVLALGKKG